MEEKLSLSPEYHHLPHSYIALLHRLERKELEWEKVKDKEKTERGFQEKIAEFKKIYQDSAVKVVKKRGNVWGEGVIKEDWDQEN